MMILSVNIDHIATIRQARLGVDPDPVMAATLAILGGAEGITLHLREDRRHVSDRDLNVLRQVITTNLNLEMAATPEMIAIALELKPDMVTLVPEKREELTTEGGLDVSSHFDKLKDAIKQLQEAGIAVSLFINPTAQDIDISLDTGTNMVEIHTGLYANARGKNIDLEINRIITSAKRAVALGLIANAGHGLNYQNIKPIASIKSISGLYIGHGIISRAVMIGMKEAVSQMKTLMLEK
ncbi:MAG: pyridoxine 5'-phosphate synthase [Nitrospirae bacterium]|nr:pyridoxine 5'-phosphate synthase [Nitrospirota bacterium]